MYDQDSFFTLSDTGQIGLVFVSLALTACMLFFVWRLVRFRSIALRMLVAMLLFAAFDWLSPQAYYTYYRTIIPGLPLQWVIDPWPNFLALAELLSFTGPANLSAHGRGVLGWALLIVSAFGGYSRVLRQDNDN